MSDRKNLPATRDDVPKFRWAGVDWPMGPAMINLPHDKMRAFVIAWTQLVNVMQRGAKKQAAQLAGYEANADNMSHQGSDLLIREDVQRAIREMDERRMSTIGHKALRALEAQIESPMAKGHMKATELALSYYMPREALVRHTVEHINPETEALDLYRAMKAQGAKRETLEFTFGAIGIDRYERMLAKEGGTAPQRMREAIDVTPTEVDEDW